MIRSQRCAHRWLWLLLLPAGFILLTIAVEHRPRYPLADEAAAAAQTDPSR